MAAIVGPGDHLQQHNLPQMVRGTSCGGDPDHLRHDISHNRLLDIDIIATYITYNHALYLFELGRHNN